MLINVLLNTLQQLVAGGHWMRVVTHNEKFYEGRVVFAGRAVLRMEDPDRQGNTHLLLEMQDATSYNPNESGGDRWYHRLQLVIDDIQVCVCLGAVSEGAGGR